MRRDYENDYPFRIIKTECLINGERKNFDAQASCDLQEAKDFYSHFTYIGSSKIWYADGVKQVEEKESHFFVKNF